MDTACRLHESTSPMQAANTGPVQSRSLPGDDVMLVSYLLAAMGSTGEAKDTTTGVGTDTGARDDLQASLVSPCGTMRPLALMAAPLSSLVVEPTVNTSLNAIGLHGELVEAPPTGGT